jgi:hypothetical protein
MGGVEFVASRLLATKKRTLSLRSGKIAEFRPRQLPATSGINFVATMGQNEATLRSLT